MTSKIELHKACAEIANASYYFDMPGSKDVVAGYTRNKAYDTHNEYSGFQGCVFEKGNTVVIAYRGTDNVSLFSALNAHLDYKDEKKPYEDRIGGDDGSYAAMSYNELPEQYKDAEALYNKVVNDPKYKGKKIVATGHSSGGGLVQLVVSKRDEDGSIRDVEGITFNAYGRKSFLDKPGDEFYDVGNTYNYFIRGDNVGRKQNQPGKAISFPVSFSESVPDYTRVAELSELRDRGSSFSSYHDIIHFVNASDEVWDASANSEKQKAYKKMDRIYPRRFFGLF